MRFKMKDYGGLMQAYFEENPVDVDVFSKKKKPKKSSLKGNCARCNEPIAFGRYCNDCLDFQNANFEKVKYVFTSYARKVINMINDNKDISLVNELTLTAFKNADIITEDCKLTKIGMSFLELLNKKPYQNQYRLTVKYEV